MKKSLLAIATLLMLAPVRSEAHIKWFCAYDTTIPPLPIRDVLAPTFASIAILFCALMFTAYVIDRAVNSSDWAKRFDNAIFRSDSYTRTIIRVAVGMLFLALWESGGVILTPELKTTASWFPGCSSQSLPRCCPVRR